ncbi:GNAT family N-acetyltransferase [Chondrinema litorale]|uniref:GNAT family N-acetyltransferase n=1 Tax=Chondrinema litorale TaxID=2994555 RepID=UPI0025432767|nr:GNAT family N-acetyltransferase [Chondrinema litorale]UZR95292.1 GNAT family N-acetyltransferase [Chondrinema litorale]
MFSDIKTERLRLSQLQAADIPNIVSYASNKKVADMTMNIPHPYKEEDAIYWINSANEGFKRRTQFTFRVAIKESNKFIGGMGLKIDNRFNKAELGYWIGEPYWGNGYATEAAGAVLSFGFEVLNLNKIFATHLIDNPASGKVMKKNGMIKEAELVEHFRKDEKYLTVVQYRLTRKEYEERKM